MTRERDGGVRAASGLVFGLRVPCSWSPGVCWRPWTREGPSPGPSFPRLGTASPARVTPRTGERRYWLLREHTRFGSDTAGALSPSRAFCPRPTQPTPQAFSSAAAHLQLRSRRTPKDTVTSIQQLRRWREPKVPPRVSWRFPRARATTCLREFFLVSRDPGVPGEWSPTCVHFLGVPRRPQKEASHFHLPSRLRGARQRGPLTSPQSRLCALDRTEHCASLLCVTRGGGPAGAGLRPTAPREASRSSRSARATASPRVAPIVMQTLCCCGRRRLPRPDSSELRVTAKAARERQRPRRSCDPAPTAHPRGLLLCVGAASAVGCGQGRDKAVALEPARERSRSVPSHRATRAIPERDAACAGGRRAGAVAELAH